MERRDHAAACRLARQSSPSAPLGAQPTLHESAPLHDADAYSTVQSVSVSMSLTYTRLPTSVGCVQVALSATS